MAPPYNETEVLQQIDNQHFYNVNLGPFIAGLAFQMFMMGVLTLQCWTYFETMSSKDSRWNRWLVGIMLFTGAFQTATDFEILYDSFVTGYGRIGYWNKYNWTFTYELGWTALIALIAQIFFLHRCFLVTKSYIFLVLCGIGAAVAFSAGVAASVGLIEAAYYTRTDMILAPGITWLIATALTDMAISAVLIVKLRNTRTSFRSTERMVSKMIRLAFETASLTSLIAILNLILYAGFGKKNSIHLFFQFTVGKMYTHSVMVTLLARSKIRGKDSENNNIHVVSESLRSRFHSNHSPDRSRKSTIADGVNVTTTRLCVTDPTPLEKPPKAQRPAHIRVNTADALRHTDHSSAYSDRHSSAYSGRHSLSALELGRGVRKESDPPFRGVGGGVGEDIDERRDENWKPVGLCKDSV